MLILAQIVLLVLYYGHFVALPFWTVWIPVYIWLGWWLVAGIFFLLALWAQQ